ncbi:hypothetical protein GOP47_0012962 [Adiantum capillus-veneris]|uniref:poly(A)-specific ribonuclease n=1 Tax=Adiantum capillus-veneris TaxID=13818 RepID=A0A9D4US87_ADICA|nr:hypothetical protein GOP47_0012962 [Adiantum capillus-veneris]
MSIPDGATIRIREVWDRDARKEFVHINRLKRKFPNISVDTEFPGSFPVYLIASTEEERIYQSLRANVDKMKLIQVGLTLTNDIGELPMIDGAYCVWQFNIRDFDITTDLYVDTSIQLLKASGIDFEKNRREGIDSRRFGSLLVKYNLVRNKKIHYICYQGDYDFAYLLKLLTGELLPVTHAEFKAKVQDFFGAVYDIRLVQTTCFHLKCGLQKFSDILGVKRISGNAHQAGSDSLLTSSAYQTIKDKYSGNCRGRSAVMPPGLVRTLVF